MKKNWRGIKYPSNSMDILAVENNPVYEKFLKGMRNYDLDVMQYKIGYHGTTKDAAKIICKDGFDPQYRKTFAYGFGDYIAQDLSIAMNYSNCGLIIVFAIPIIKSIKNVKMECGNKTFIVNNTCDEMYCLPIGIIDMKNSM
jgi:ethanolamine utilization protein EutQ (cupin superfamily)